MNNSYVQLDDLPDEILLIILKKLNNSDVLYSLFGVNKRLNAIVNDSIFTKNLTLITSFHKPLNTLETDGIFTRNFTFIKPFTGSSFEITDTILDRFCYDILPKVDNQIEQLNVESSYLERVLCATNYSNLHTLGIYNMEPEKGTEIFSDNNHLIKNFSNKIRSITVIMKQHQPQEYIFRNYNPHILRRICTRFNNLEYLNFMSSSDYEQITFEQSFPSDFSSNICELHVVMKTMMDCLNLVNGHFDNLHSLFVTISVRHARSWSPVSNHKKLPNLKCFSLIHEHYLIVYDKILIPFLQRMLNIERLSLVFDNPYGPIIDANHLSKTIIHHMIKLKEFKFNIRSAIDIQNQVNVRLNDIKKTFENFPYNPIISSVDYFEKLRLVYCHIYTYPYKWTFYYNITNNFPGGLFKSVREISLYDEHPFEHEFFLKISQAFPFLESLTLKNNEPQKHIDLTHIQPIKYPYLIEINLQEAHEDYIKQFLNNTKTCLLNNITLHINHNTFKKITNDFTTDHSENSSKIICLHVLSNDKKQVSKLKNYFRYAKIN